MVWRLMVYFATLRRLSDSQKSTARVGRGYLCCLFRHVGREVDKDQRAKAAAVGDLLVGTAIIPTAIAG